MPTASTPRPTTLFLAGALLLVLVIAACDMIPWPGRSQGERVYRGHCARCHGMDGAGNTPRYMGNPWADLLDDNWKHGSGPLSLELVIRQGVFGQMPAFEDKLSAEEIQAVVHYLRQLRGEVRPQGKRR